MGDDGSWRKCYYLLLKEFRSFIKIRLYLSVSCCLGLVVHKLKIVQLFKKVFPVWGDSPFSPVRRQSLLLRFWKTKSLVVIMNQLFLTMTPRTIGLLWCLRTPRSSLQLRLLISLILPREREFFSHWSSWKSLIFSKVPSWELHKWWGPPPQVLQGLLGHIPKILGIYIV